MSTEIKAFRDKVFSLSQLRNIYDVVSELIDNMDERAISELISGNNSDVDRLLNIIEEEAAAAMYNPDGVVTESTFDYLPTITKAFEDTLRRASLPYFGVSVLPDFKMYPHVLEWANYTQLYRLLCIMCARGHGKSYTFSFLYPLWKMFRYSNSYTGARKKEYSLSKFGMLVTNEIGLATTLLGMIKDEIDRNSVLREVLHPGKRDGWKEESISCANGAEFMVKSYGSKMRGFHPTYMIIDDYLAENVLYSNEQKQKYNKTFHSVIMNMPKTKDCQVCVIGTPFVVGDLYDDLKAKKGWKVFEYPAIFPDGEVLCEEMFSFQSLMDKREDIGSINFSREILVRSISEFSSVFSYDSLVLSYQGMDKFTLVNNLYSHPMRDHFKKISCGMDFALSSSSGADYTVFYVVAEDDMGKIWLIHVFRGRGMPYDRQVMEAKRINNDFSPDVFMVETNAGQSIFADELERGGLPVVRHQTGDDKHSMIEGVPAMSILFERGLVKLPRGDQNSKDMTDLLASQLMSVSYDPNKGKLVFVIDHDDDAMAFWQGIRGLKYVGDRFSFSFLD